MNHYIKNVKIKNLFDEKDINWNLSRVNVLVGKNGLGKSTILHLINSAVTQKGSEYLDLCDEVLIELDNEEKYHALKESISPEILEILIKEISTSDKFTNAIESFISENNKPETSNPKLFLDIKNKFLSELKKTAMSETSSTEISSLTSYKFGINIKKMETEFISTVNMSANSVNNITTSSGNNTTFLDFEINNEVKRLIDNHKNYPKMKLKLKLMTSLNNLFKETDKKIEIIDDTLEVTLNNDKKLSFKKLSSGERQVIFIFLKVINGSVNQSLILMDEPEISLHPSWQESLLTEITKVNETSQIIVVTHSPAIVMDGWLDCFVDIKNISTESVR